MAHFALTDTSNERFMAAERLARGALGLAGARSAPLHVWVKDWSVEGAADSVSADLRLRARDGPVGIDLALTTGRPPVAQGDRGLDTKGPETGNASFYYSWPRLEVAGSIEKEGARVEVEGQAWMDREWGTSALSAGVVGWDWFALHLSDGRSLMYYRLRDENGGAAPFSSGMLVDASGIGRSLGVGDVRLEPLEWWTSDVSGVQYPVRWRLDIPSEALQLEVEPYLQNQELNLSVRYWEGAVRAVGAAGGARLEADGYLELAGY
jgi:predicted secreted hydrolase